MMKRIVLLQGTGLNERGWAKMISAHGNVVLIQRTFVEHIEIWEAEKNLYSGSEIPVHRNRVLDEMTFGARNQLLVFRFWKYFNPQKADVVVAVSYSFAMLALFFRLLGRTRKVVCTIVDYLPPAGGLAVRIHRRITNIISRWVARQSDEVWTISPRILSAAANPRNFVMRFPIENNDTAANSRHEIGYIGFPTPDHALDILFAICKKHGFRLNIVGDSPYLQSIKHLAPPDTVFHGITNDSVKINSILSRCFCGYAIYRNIGPGNYSYYGFPSKTLHWFANNTPVVTTNTSLFTDDIAQSGTGCVVEPVLEQIEQAVLDMRAHFPFYYEAINRFRETWNAGAKQFLHERFGALLKPAGDDKP
jgi:glycosyltransferase involved in cell wall biosynthesis